jgi:hypothetical protein
LYDYLVGGFYESANEQLSAQKHKTVLVPIRKNLKPENLFPKPNPFVALPQQLD